jgi:hypothetical protein
MNVCDVGVDGWVRSLRLKGIEKWVTVGSSVCVCVCANANVPKSNTKTKFTQDAKKPVVAEMSKSGFS